MSDATESVNVVMRDHGFSPSQGGGIGKWYSREAEHEGRKVLLAVKDEEGVAMPESLDSPVVVALHDLSSGEVIRSRRFASLSGYLQRLQRDPERPLA